MNPICDLEVIANFSCHIGENPLWHADDRCLYWVDIPTAKLFRLRPETKEVEIFHTGLSVGGITIHEDGRLLLFMAHGVVKLWQDGNMEVVVGVLPGEEGNRFNDVIADPEGRVFCGVMSTQFRRGRLYRLDPNGNFTVVIEETNIANGMGFSPDLKQMYFCDSGEGTISMFDYDRGSGDICNRRLLAKPPPSRGLPDGMTVDADGSIWSARWDGSCLVKMSPEGKIVQHVSLPTRKISSLTFGGDNLTDVYVTSAGGENPAANGELAGALFRLNLGVRGRPEFRSRTT